MQNCDLLCISGSHLYLMGTSLTTKTGWEVTFLRRFAYLSRLVSPCSASACTAASRGSVAVLHAKSTSTRLWLHFFTINSSPLSFSRVTKHPAHHSLMFNLKCLNSFFVILRLSTQKRYYSIQAILRFQIFLDCLWVVNELWYHSRNTCQIEFECDPTLFSAMAGWKAG